jgi:hypothetical protein
MSKEGENGAKALGIDIGTSRIVVAQRVQNEFRFDSQLNAFVNVPFSKFTQQVFQKEHIPHKVAGSEMLVFGNESERLANMFNRETRRPMLRGLLNPEEPDGLDLLLYIINTLAGAIEKRPQKVCFSIPGPGGSADELTFHESTLRDALARAGYEASSINEGLAVVLAELESSSYTGIGISCGGGMCNVCLAYLSIPVFTFSIPKAGDFIDAGAASVTGENATRIRSIKEAGFRFNGHFTDKIQHAIGVYYEEMIRSLTAGLKDAFAQSRNMPKVDRPVPMVISGGSVLPAGFLERFANAVKEAKLPIPVSEIRLSADPLNATAKGALVSALAS